MDNLFNSQTHPVMKQNAGEKTVSTFFQSWSVLVCDLLIHILLPIFRAEPMSYQKGKGCRESMFENCVHADVGGSRETVLVSFDIYC